MFRHAPSREPSEELVEPVLNFGVKLFHLGVVQEDSVLCLPDIYLSPVQCTSLTMIIEEHPLSSPEPPGLLLRDEPGLADHAVPGGALLPRHQPAPEAGLEDEDGPQPPPGLQFLITDQWRMLPPPPTLNLLGSSLPLHFYYDYDYDD